MGKDKHQEKTTNENRQMKQTAPKERYKRHFSKTMGMTINIPRDAIGVNVYHDAANSLREAISKDDPELLTYEPFTPPQPHTEEGR